MKDSNDKTTQSIDLGPEPKRRGRPATGNAKTRAEIQREYRERKKSQSTENMHKAVAEDLRSELHKMNARAELDEQKIKKLEAELAEARIAIEELARDSVYYMNKYNELKDKK